MASQIDFIIRVEYHRTEPTGDRCEVCEDVPYLHAWNAVIKVDASKEWQTEIYLCESCKDVIKRCDSDIDWH